MIGFYFHILTSMKSPMFTNTFRNKMILARTIARFLCLCQNHYPVVTAPVYAVVGAYKYHRLNVYLYGNHKQTHTSPTWEQQEREKERQRDRKREREKLIERVSDEKHEPELNICVLNWNFHSFFHVNSPPNRISKVNPNK